MGRDSSRPTEADYQQAKRELTGEDDIDPQQENLESLGESEAWNLSEIYKAEALAGRDFFNTLRREKGLD